MMFIPIAVIVIVFLVIIVICLLVWLISSSSSSKIQGAVHAKSIDILRQQLESLKGAQDKTSDGLQKSLQQGQVTIGQSLQSSQKVLDNLNSRIGELQGTNKQMLQVGSQVKRLENILASPKLRGQLGEKSLENLLAQLLPKESYKLQHTLKDGKIVDALVELKGYSIPIDAKFPLPSFEKIGAAGSDDEKSKARKVFVRDVIKHIDKIAGDYIRPTEGTLDFALMYVPAENVYYETIVSYSSADKDIAQYALDKKVIPVSPNLLYAYLMTVSMGLMGMQIEQQAAEIRRNLKKLNADFADFLSNWDTLGTHIKNTSNKYDEGAIKLNRFGMHLEQIQIEEE